MSIIIYAKKTNFDRRDIDIAYGSLADLRSAVLKRTDALVGSCFASVFEQVHFVHGPLSCSEEFSGIVSEFRSQCDTLKLNTKTLERYGLCSEDVDCLLTFVLDVELTEQMSIPDTRSFAKWLDIFINIEAAKEELGDKHPFADIPKCIIFDRNLYSDEEWEKSEIDGITRLYDVVEFAARNSLPLRFR